ncbi:MAG: hypothetical protein EA369_06755 [Bradymonadales bacterium]|nr:MAG: hypothetical protein EA369_06755 [Bradymonadales bacterium]
MIRKLCLCALMLLGATACGGRYQGVATRAWDQMARSNTDQALAAYEKVDRPQDQLLRILDEAILLRVARRFEESNQRFFEAARILETRDYLSLTGEAAGLLADQRAVFYQGEDFEKVLVHLYLALNFLALEDRDSALVEVRRVNEIMTRFISEAKRPYQLNAFARYLGALLYEASREFNDAWIAYRATREILSAQSKEEWPELLVDMARMAKRMGFRDELESLKEEMSSSSKELFKRVSGPQTASVVLLFEAGKSPRKKSRRQRYQADAGDFLFPLAYYESRPTRIRFAQLLWEPSSQQQELSSRVLFDTDETGRRHLEHRMGVEVGKALARAGVRAGIATGVGILTESEDLGILAGLLLFAMTDADTRSWLLLPQSYQVQRAFLAPGRYAFRLQYLDASGRVIREEALDEIELGPGEIRFIQIRSFE